MKKNVVKKIFLYFQKTIFKTLKKSLRWEKENLNGNLILQQQLDKLNIKVVRSKKRNKKLTCLIMVKLRNIFIKVWKSFMDFQQHSNRNDNAFWICEQMGGLQEEVTDVCNSQGWRIIDLSAFVPKKIQSCFLKYFFYLSFILFYHLFLFFFALLCFFF